MVPWIDPFGVFPIDFDFRVNAGPPAVTAMPGYTGDVEGMYIARFRMQDDFAGGEVYEYEVLTKHEPPPKRRASPTSSPPRPRKKKSNKRRR